MRTLASAAGPAVVGVALLAASCSWPAAPGAPPAAAALPVAPPFAATAASGERLDLPGTRGRWRALFFFCGCTPCRQTAKLLDSRTGHPGDAVIWGISDLNPADVRLFARETGARFPLASDANSAIREAYRVEGCPTVVLVDPSGRTRERWSGRSGRQLSALLSLPTRERWR